MPLSVTQFLILCIIFGLSVLLYFYYVWRNSEYRNQSINSFLKVHFFLLFEKAPPLFRKFFCKSQGMYGEYLIFLELEKIPGYGKILVNLYLPQGQTVTDTELDILFIHESGIYIIESKSYTGWIFGNSNDHYWTEQFSRHRKFSFYNPLWQNLSHTKSLEKIIPNYSKAFISLVVFSNNAILKKIYSPNNKVINLRELRKEIRNYPKILQITEVDKLCILLSQYRNISSEQEIQHSQEIANIQIPLSSYLHKI